MGNIDNLNFELILKDDKFNKKVDAAIKKAQSLNTSLSSILTASNNITGALKNASTELSGMTGNAKGLKKAIEDSVGKAKDLSKELSNGNTIQKDTNRHTQRQTRALQEQSVILKQITGLASTYFSVQGVSRFLSTLVQITGEFEVQQQSLRVILNDARKADDIFERLRQFAVESPYTFQELASYTKQLAAFDIPADKLLETNKMLADVAAGLGVSMDRIILAYGHVKSSGFLRGQQLRQFTQNGVPILKELADILSEVEHKTVSVSQVFDRMSKREIPFEYVEEAFKRMTSEGGKFYRMQEVLVETLKGRMGKLRDVWQQAVYDLGKANSGTLKGAVDLAIKLASNFKSLATWIAPVVKGLGAYGAALAIVAVAQKAMSIGSYVKYFSLLIAGYRNASLAVRAFGVEAVRTSGAASLATKAWAGAIGVVATAISMIPPLVNWIKKLSETTDEAGKVTAKVEAEYRSTLAVSSDLINQMKKMTVGTREYENAQKKLLDVAGKHLTTAEKEAIAIGNLSGVYDSLALSMQKAAKEDFVNTTLSEARTTYANTMTGIVNDLRTAFSHLDAEVESELIGYLYGNKTKEQLSDAVKELYHAKNPVTGYEVGEIVLDSIKKRADAALNTLEETSKHARKLADNLIFDTEDTGSNLEDPKWIEKVKKALAKISPETLNKVKLMPNDNEDYYDYLERIGKEWKQIKEERDKALKVDKPAKQAMLDAISVVDRALEGNILKDARYNKEPWNATDHTETDNEKQIKSRIAVLGKLKKAYDDLIGLGKTDEDALEALLNFDGFKELKDDILDGNFDERIIELIQELRKTDPNGAANLAATYGLNAWNLYLKKMKESETEAEKAKKKVEAYKDLMEKWNAEDFNLEGTGFEFDVRKILRDYNTELGNLEIKKANAVKKATEAYKNDSKALGEEIEKIDKLTEAEKNYLKARYQEKLTDLAKGRASDLVKGLDMNDWSDKTIGQITRIQNKLDKIITSVQSGDLELPPEVIESINKGEFSLDQFREALLRIIKEYKKNTIEEKQKAIHKAIRSGMSDLKELSSALNSIGESSANDNLQDATEYVSGLVQNMEAAEKGHEKYGGWWGYIIGALEDVGKQLLEDIAYSKQLERAIANQKMLKWAADMDKILNNKNGTLGASWLLGLHDAVDVLNESLSKLSSTMDYLNAQKIKETYNSSVLNPLPVETLVDNIGNDKFRLGRLNPLAMHNLDFVAYQAAIKKGYTGIEKYIVKTKNRSKFLNTLGFRDEYNNLKDIIEGMGYELYDEYDNINADALQAVLDTYKKLGSADKKWMTEAIEYSKKYKEAMEQIKDTVRDTFGDMAKSLASNMITAFDETGNAVANLAESFDDLGKSIVESMLEAAIYETVLKKYEDHAVKLFKQYGEGGMSYTEMLENVNSMFESIDEDLNNSADVFNAILARARDFGWNEEKEDNETVGKGISSITEDTANLLASYLNAMRGDVSIMRLEQTGFFGFMRSQMPTLNDHLARIEAYSYDISRSNARILAEMQSVIGNVGSGGTHSVKVELIQ